MQIQLLLLGLSFFCSNTLALRCYQCAKREHFTKKCIPGSSTIVECSQGQVCGYGRTETGRDFLNGCEDSKACTNDVHCKFCEADLCNGLVIPKKQVNIPLPKVKPMEFSSYISLVKDSGEDDTNQRPTGVPVRSRANTPNVMKDETPNVSDQGSQVLVRDSSTDSGIIFEPSMRRERPKMFDLPTVTETKSSSQTGSTTEELITPNVPPPLMDSRNKLSFENQAVPALDQGKKQELETETVLKEPEVSKFIAKAVIPQVVIDQPLDISKTIGTIQVKEQNPTDAVDLVKQIHKLQDTGSLVEEIPTNTNEEKVKVVNIPAILAMPEVQKNTTSESETTPTNGTSRIIFSLLNPVYSRPDMNPQLNAKNQTDNSIKVSDRPIIPLLPKITNVESENTQERMHYQLVPENRSDVFNVSKFTATAEEVVASKDRSEEERKAHDSLDSDSPKEIENKKTAELNVKTEQSVSHTDSSEETVSEEVIELSKPIPLESHKLNSNIGEIVQKETPIADAPKAEIVESKTDNAKNETTTNLSQEYALIESEVPENTDTELKEKPYPASKETESTPNLRSRIEPNDEEASIETETISENKDVKLKANPNPDSTSKDNAFKPNLRVETESKEEKEALINTEITENIDEKLEPKPNQPLALKKNEPRLSLRAETDYKGDEEEELIETEETENKDAKLKRKPNQTSLSKENKSNQNFRGKTESKEKEAAFIKTEVIKTESKGKNLKQKSYPASTSKESQFKPNLRGETESKEEEDSIKVGSIEEGSEPKPNTSTKTSTETLKLGDKPTTSRKDQAEDDNSSKEAEVVDDNKINQKEHEMIPNQQIETSNIGQIEAKKIEISKKDEEDITEFQKEIVINSSINSKDSISRLQELHNSEKRPLGTVSNADEDMLSEEKVDVIENKDTPIQTSKANEPEESFQESVKPPVITKTGTQVQNEKSVLSEHRMESLETLNSGLNLDAQKEILLAEKRKSSIKKESPKKYIPHKTETSNPTELVSIVTGEALQKDDLKTPLVQNKTTGNNDTQMVDENTNVDDEYFDYGDLETQYSELNEVSVPKDSKADSKLSNMWLKKSGDEKRGDDLEYFDDIDLDHQASEIIEESLPHGLSTDKETAIKPDEQDHLELQPSEVVEKQTPGCNIIAFDDISSLSKLVKTLTNATITMNDTDPIKPNTILTQELAVDDISTTTINNNNNNNLSSTTLETTSATEEASTESSTISTESTRTVSDTTPTTEEPIVTTTDQTTTDESTQGITRLTGSTTPETSTAMTVELTTTTPTPPPTPCPNPFAFLSCIFRNNQTYCPFYLVPLQAAALDDNC